MYNKAIEITPYDHARIRQYKQTDKSPDVSAFVGVSRTMHALLFSRGKKKGSCLAPSHIKYVRWANVSREGLLETPQLERQMHAIYFIVKNSCIFLDNIPGLLIFCKSMTKYFENVSSEFQSGSQVFRKITRVPAIMRFVVF